MSEPIKFTQEELDGLGKIQTKYQENTFRFGQLYLDKRSLDERFKQLTESEASLKNNFLEIQKEEETWLSSITAKYGEGSLSLKDGTFIPTKK
jgi:predicted nuclease with TOPRIM domain